VLFQSFQTSNSVKKKEDSEYSFFLGAFSVIFQKTIKNPIFSLFFEVFEKSSEKWLKNGHLGILSRYFGRFLKDFKFETELSGDFHDVSEDF